VRVHSAAGFVTKPMTLLIRLEEDADGGGGGIEGPSVIEKAPLRMPPK